MHVFRGCTRGDVRRLVGLIALALLVRALLFLVAVEDPERFLRSDSSGYLKLGLNFGTTYLAAEPDPNLVDVALLRTPGYPAWLAMVLMLGGGTLNRVILAQVFVSAGTVALVYGLTRPRFGRGAAGAASLILCLEPLSVAYSLQVLTETLFTFFLVAGVWLWLGAHQGPAHRRMACAGGLFAAGAIIRPVLLYIPLLLVPLTVLWSRGQGMGRRVLLVGSLLVGFLLPVGGLVAYNQARFGIGTVTTIDARNMLYYRAAGVLMAKEGIGREVAASRLRARLRQRIGEGEPPSSVYRSKKRLAIEIIRGNPMTSLEVAFEGAFRMWKDTGWETIFAVAGVRSREDAEKPVLWKRLPLAIFTVVIPYLGALLGIAWLVRQGSWGTLAWAGGILFYLTIVSAGPESYARFRLPAMPFVAMLAGIGYGALRGGFGRRSRTRSG